MVGDNVQSAARYVSEEYMYLVQRLSREGVGLKRVRNGELSNHNGDVI